MGLEYNYIETLFARVIMLPVVCVKTNLESAYEDCTFWGSVKDRFKIQHEGNVYIDDLKLQITKVVMPPNFHEKAYFKNLFIASKSAKSRESILAPKTNRIMDYRLLTDFQKKLFAYSVAKSIELILRIRKKSIRSSCIVIYDAADSIVREAIYEISKKAEYIILVSHNINMLKKIQDYIMTEFGVTPIITPDFDFAVQCADFLVCSEKNTIHCKSPVWYIDNNYIPEENGFIYANDVVYKTPWDREGVSMYPEVLGAILCQMQEKDIEKALKLNDIYLSEVRFNDSVL